MQKISRADDNIWSVSAFDPKKPYSDDWASKAPSPILRSGDEDRIFSGGPHDHHHLSDSMSWSDDSHHPTDEDYHNPESEHYDPYTDPRYEEGGDIPEDYPDRSVPDHDLRSIDLYSRDLSSRGAGRLEGSQGHYVEYPTGSSVSHYYTHDPSQVQNNRWNLVSIHSLLRDPIISYHPSFYHAINEASAHRSELESRVNSEMDE